MKQAAVGAAVGGLIGLVMERKNKRQQKSRSVIKIFYLLVGAVLGSISIAMVQLAIQDPRFQKHMHHINEQVHHLRMVAEKKIVSMKRKIESNVMNLKSVAGGFQSRFKSTKYRNEHNERYEENTMVFNNY